MKKKKLKKKAELGMHFLRIEKQIWVSFIY